MATIFHERVIISGNEVEHYQYNDLPVLRGYSRKKRKSKQKKLNFQLIAPAQKSAESSMPILNLTNF